jgi:GNAT superfamily N-acetyltransferase
MIQIRSSTEADFMALVPLYRGFYRLHRQLLGGSEAIGVEEAIEITKEAMDPSAGWLIVAQDADSGRLAGFAHWEERQGAFFGRELYVDPDHRGRGIGSRLQKEVEQRVRQAGGKALFVSILPHNHQMLTFALRRGYDTLNTLELRKELTDGQARRSQVSLLDLEFKII